MRDNTMVSAVQIVETLCDEFAAQSLYLNMLQQEGVTHVRMLQPTKTNPGFRVQALMLGEEPAGPLPYGMKRVTVRAKTLLTYQPSFLEGHRGETR